MPLTEITVFKNVFFGGWRKSPVATLPSSKLTRRSLSSHHFTNEMREIVRAHRIQFFYFLLIIVFTCWILLGTIHLCWYKDVTASVCNDQGFINWKCALSVYLFLHLHSDIKVYIVQSGILLWKYANILSNLKVHFTN